MTDGELSFTLPCIACGAEISRTVPLEAFRDELEALECPECGDDSWRWEE